MAESDNEHLVTLAVVHALRGFGLHVAAMTPLVIDGAPQAGRWTSARLERLGLASSFRLPSPALSPYVLPPAATPLQAVQAAGLTLDVEAVIETYQVLSTWADAIVVEGVGGLAVPLGPGLCVHDVASRLDLPIVLALRDDGGVEERAERAIALAHAKSLDAIGWVATGVVAGSTRKLSALAHSLGLQCLGALPVQAHAGAAAATFLDSQALQCALGIVPARRIVRRWGTTH
ncbi:MAG: dethiobiotin synthase [Ramlibacter sp.]|nr:dethiobiotin synthase [Ramlibacter sp.]